jgi:uncharacterized transporter YbjL
MNQAEIREFLQANMFYILAAYLVIGVLLGLIPFFVARRRGKARLGLIALLVTVIVGLVSPLLAVVSVLIFTFVAARKSQTADASTEDAGQ